MRNVSHLCALWCVGNFRTLSKSRSVVSVLMAEGGAHVSPGCCYKGDTCASRHLGRDAIRGSVGRQRHRVHGRRDVEYADEHFTSPRPFLFGRAGNGKVASQKHHLSRTHMVLCTRSVAVGTRRRSTFIIEQGLFAPAFATASELKEHIHQYRGDLFPHERSAR